MSETSERSRSRQGKDPECDSALTPVEGEREETAGGKGFRCSMLGESQPSRVSGIQMAMEGSQLDRNGEPTNLPRLRSCLKCPEKCEALD